VISSNRRINCGFVEQISEFFVMFARLEKVTESSGDERELHYGRRENVGL
jgi:hypothetical protein